MSMSEGDRSQGGVRSQGDHRSNSRAVPHLSRRKTRDQSLILLFVGVILLMPPMAAIFDLGTHVGGIPIALVYLFVVWALLIIGALFISRRLDAAGEPTEPSGDPVELPNEIGGDP